MYNNFVFHWRFFALSGAFSVWQDFPLSVLWILWISRCWQEKQYVGVSVEFWSPVSSTLTSSQHLRGAPPVGDMVCVLVAHCVTKGLFVAKQWEWLETGDICGYLYKGAFWLVFRLLSLSQFPLAASESGEVAYWLGPGSWVRIGHVQRHWACSIWSTKWLGDRLPASGKQNNITEKQNQTQNLKEKRG